MQISVGNLSLFKFNDYFNTGECPSAKKALNAVLKTEAEWN